MENIVYYCKYNSCASRIGKIISDWMFQSDSSVQIVSEVDKGLQSLSEKHESLCKSVEELSTKIEALRDTDLWAKFQDKTFSLSTPSDNTASLSAAANIVEEINERECRKKNLIIFNFPETSAFDHKAETNTFTNFCKSVKVKITKLVRLGKKLDDKIRPLLIGLDSEDNKRTIFTNSSCLKSIEEFSDVYISPDLTRIEREKQKKPREGEKLVKLGL